MFIILPVGMNYETKRAPVVTFALMGVNILVYLISLGFVLNKGDDAQMWIYLFDGSVESGPFDLFQIQHMLSQGTLSTQAQYWSEGMTEWRSVSELSGGVTS